MSNFPPELLFDILSRLPPKDLIRFLCVSKAWNAVIRRHHFITAHLQHSIQTNSFRTILLSSSDFFSSAFDDSETFGPVVKIEQPLKCPYDYTEILGCSINGVVCIHNENRGDLALWNPSIQKFKKIPLPTFEIEQRPSSFGVIPEYGFGEKYMKFGTPVGDEVDNYMMNLKVLGGSLCICVHQFCPRCDIWIMKEYGVTRSWTLLYSFENGGSRYCKPLVFSKNGARVLLNKDRKKFVWFDLRGKNGYQVNVCRLPRSFDSTICVGSLSLIDGDPVIGGRQQ